MNRFISIRNAHPRLRVPRAAARKAIGLLDRHAEKFRGGCPPGELSLVFLTDPELARIHDEFLDDPAPTDVITFEGSGAEGLANQAGSAGEICVSVDTAARFVGLSSGAARRSLDKAGTLSRSNGQAQALQSGFAAELTLYLVHGWLHLAGYDDRKPAKKRQMRAAEKRAMDLLRKALAIPAFRVT